MRLSASSITYTQGNQCIRYGRDQSMYGWRDLPSYAALESLLKQRPSGWRSLCALVKMQPALLNSRHPSTGLSFLQKLVREGVDGKMFDALTAASPTVGLLSTLRRATAEP